MDIRLFNTMDAGFCVDCLEEAIKAYGRPEIFNSDQGSQFTSDCFAGALIKKKKTTLRSVWMKDVEHWITFLLSHYIAFMS